jgi:molybdenum cofactor guanylyltransferase
VDKNLITGIVLAGGRGSRMGGIDKGLQLYNDTPLAKHAIQRLQPQVGNLLINANRNLEIYKIWGSDVNAEVIVDGLADFAGPLAGFLVGLQQCKHRVFLQIWLRAYLTHWFKITLISLWLAVRMRKALCDINLFFV